MSWLITLLVLFTPSVLSLEAVLTGCTAVGSYYRCVAGFDYVGPFAGESLNITRYSSIDGDYVPLSPVQVVLNTTSMTLATALYNKTYPLAEWSSFGLCAGSAATSVWFECFNTQDALNAIPAPVLANGFTANPCGFSGADALPAATNTSTFSPAFCPINAYKAAIGLKKVTTGKLYSAGLNSLPGVFGLKATYSTDDVPGVATFTGTFGTAMASTSSPISVSITKYPTITSFLYPFWYEADNGTKYVPNSFVMQNYWNYVSDRDWFTYLYGGSAEGHSTYQVVNGSASNRVLVRWQDYCDKVSWYCDPITNKPVGLKSPILTTDLWNVMPEGFTSVDGVIKTTSSVGSLTTTIGITALFKRLPPAVKLLSYSASQKDNYVAIQGLNSGNAGQLSLIVNYTSGPSANPTISIPAGAFSFRIDSRAVSSVCAGTQCLDIIYALESTEIAPIVTPVANIALVGATTQSEFIFRTVMISVVGFIVLVLIVLALMYWRRRRAFRAGRNIFGKVN